MQTDFAPSIKVVNCRRCGKLIYFTNKPNGTRIPVDFDPDDFKSRARFDAVAGIVNLSEVLTFDKYSMRPHFSSCRRSI